MTNIFYGNQFVEKFNCDGSKKSDHKEAKRFIRNSIIALFVMSAGVGAVVGGYKLGAISNVQIALAEKEVDVTDIKFSRKIEDMQMKLVEDLMSCETPSKKDTDGWVTYDPDKTGKPESVASIGRLQFKVPTVILYQKKLYGVEMTGTDAVKLALDTEKAKVLARDIMFKSKNKAVDWQNCANKLDLNRKIDLIKQLEK